MPCMQNSTKTAVVTSQTGRRPSLVSSFVNTGIMRKRAMVVLLLVIARRARTSSGDFSALCSEGDMRDPDTAGTLQGRHWHFFTFPTRSTLQKPCSSFTHFCSARIHGKRKWF